MMTTSIVPPTWEEPIQKSALPSQGLPVEQGLGLGECQTLWSALLTGDNSEPRTPSWWRVGRSIHRESLGELSVALVQQLTWQQATSLQLQLSRRDVRLVAGPTQSSGVVSLGLLAPPWFPWYQGFPGKEEGGNLGTGSSSAMLCRECGDTSQSPMQGSTGPSKVYGTPYVPQWRWNSRAFPAQACEQGTQNVFNARRGDCSWVLNYYLRKVRRLQHFPANTRRRLPNPKTQLSGLMLPAHLPPLPWHQGTGVTSQVLLEELDTGIAPSTLYHWIQQTTLMTGSLPTCQRRTSYQVGVQSSGPSTIQVPGPSVMPKNQD